MSDRDETPPPTPPLLGVMVNRSTQLSIGKFSISIGPEGAVASDLTLSLALNLTPYWSEIAVTHVLDAVRYHTALLKACSAGDKDGTSGAMENECKSSMQAIVSAAVALDAFYAVVREQVPLPDELVRAWKRNRTPRYAQLFEVFKQGFAVDPKVAEELRDAIRKVFRWRDWAVHPPGAASEPVAYPELNVATEWRVFAFRAENARNITDAALGIIFHLLKHPRQDSAKLRDFCTPALAILQPTLDAWRSDVVPTVRHPAPPESG